MIAIGRTEQGFGQIGADVLDGFAALAGALIAQVMASSRANRASSRDDAPR